MQKVDSLYLFPSIHRRAGWSSVTHSHHSPVICNRSSKHCRWEILFPGELKWQKNTEKTFLGYSSLFCGYLLVWLFYRLFFRFDLLFNCDRELQSVLENLVTVMCKLQVFGVYFFPTGSRRRWKRDERRQIDFTSFYYWHEERFCCKTSDDLVINRQLKQTTKSTGARELYQNRFNQAVWDQDTFWCLEGEIMNARGSQGRS